jgi:methyl-accepting chemotaxis protein
MNWPLKKKLYVSFGVIVALVVALGVVVHLYLGDARQLVREQQRYQGVALLAQSSYTTLLQARRNEKDFFARDADPKFLALHQQHVTEFVAGMASLRAELTSKDDEYVSGVISAETAFKHYETAFASSVRALERRGTPESGLQLEFRNAAHSVERLASDLHDDKLTLLLLQARRYEKDFLLRNDPKAAERMRAAVDQAESHVRTTPALAARAEQLAVLLEEYRSKFDAAEIAQKELDTLKQDLHAATQSVEQALDALLAKASARAVLANQETLAVIGNTDVVLAVLFFMAIGIALLVGRVLSGQVVTATSALIQGTQRIASGDLTSEVRVDVSDELGELATSFNKMGASIRNISNDINAATGSMNEMVRELQATVSEQGAAMQQQASSVSETVATVEELARSSEQVTDIVSRVIDAAARSVETSRSGRTAIQQSVNGMSDVREQVEQIARTILDLSERTQQIGSIIATVDDFAEQSSLLALNASIEAARAGEHGKAFAVVAAEVKSLAEQSQRATERVRNILNEIQRVTHTAVMVTEEGSKRVERGVGLVSGAGDIIAELAGSIEASADSAKQIAAAARQQSNGIEQISVAMSGIDQFARQNVEAIRQTETTSHTLAGIALQLKTAAGQYRV